MEDEFTKNVSQAIAQHLMDKGYKVTRMDHRSILVFCKPYDEHWLTMGKTREVFLTAGSAVSVTGWTEHHLDFYLVEHPVGDPDLFDRIERAVESRHSIASSAIPKQDQP